MLKDNSKEIFPVVDECGNVVGKATRGECHGGGKLLHPVVHLHVFDEEGRLFCSEGRCGRIFSPANGTQPWAGMLIMEKRWLTR